jgi:F-type H+-transporting ATPase subunit delta
MTNATAGAQTDHFEADVGALHVARVYAEALLDAAVKRNQVDQVLEELRELVAVVLEPNPQLADFFANKTISKEKKAELLQRVFPGRVSELLANFLLVLNDHERLDLIRPILHAYTDLTNARARRMIVQVQSAVPLLDHQRQRLADELRQAFRQEPVLQTAVDPDLLGGLVVRVGDWLYDASLRKRLETVRKRIIERGSHVTI